MGLHGYGQLLQPAFPVLPSEVLQRPFQRAESPPSPAIVEPKRSGVVGSAVTANVVPPNWVQGDLELKLR